MEMSMKTQPEETQKDRAVSPVIGVILMVAITVILAAVIAAFVLDLGQSTSASVDAGVSIDSSSEGVGLQLTDQGSADDGVRLEASIIDYQNVVSGDEDDVDLNEYDEHLSSVGDSFTFVAESSNPDPQDEEITIRVTAIAESGDDENVVSSSEYTVVVQDT
ncbi:type IV pilin N-terminal domain-containing protein [Natronoglomus mannanivorans]|uniref:Type IV pilin N-terminal domain-containing protein n=1 Tax=Natronoglomus mannanivorans TaxID=2979990 RepID=A0AAP3E183_9EURY|nr:type IV pilin N-terminal domain-containing protein [Halobacteria archaeon AArc-xg1-1]